MSSRRLCPLCEAEMADERCRVHDVPTIAVGTTGDPPAKLEVGTVIVGRYTIDGLLSQGGMGALLRTRDRTTGDTVVVKVLRGQRIAELQNVRRFYQEARVASSLHHPNIVRIIEFGVDEATRAPFLAMEYVEGQTLKALIGGAGALSELQTALLFVQITRALLEAHMHGILHRDLKPSNVMVSTLSDGEEHVKVLDFGLAKILHGDGEMPPLTQPGKTVGTPAYMSPEQVTQRPQDFRSDLYGMGCMLHTALTGAPPFIGDDLIQVMRKQMRDPPPPLPPRLFDGRPPSPSLVNMHRSLLKKAKNERPTSTEEVVRTFEHILASFGRSHTTSPKEPRHFEVLDAETRIEGQAGVSTKPAHDHISDDALAIAAADTSVEREPSSTDAATVLTRSFTARGESATILGGNPVRMPSLVDTADPVENVFADPASSAELEFDNTSAPEATDPERTTGGRAAPGFVEPDLPSGVRATLEPHEDTDASALETMRGVIDELGTFDASSENVLTTILPSDLDDSEMVDAPTPMQLLHEEASDTRRIDTDDPGWPIPPADPMPIEAPRDTRPHPADLIAASMNTDPESEEEPAPTPPVVPVAVAPSSDRRRPVIVWLLAAALIVAATALIPAIRRQLDGASTSPTTVDDRPPLAPRPKVDKNAPTIVPRIRQVWVDSRPSGATVFIGEKRGYRTASVELPADVADSLEVRLKKNRR